MQITWKSLNKRQQDYLAAIYLADQEVEARERSVSWTRGERARPADQWRWMPYASSFPSGLLMPVKKHLSWTEQISEGTGSTLEALEQRELIVMQHLSVEDLHRRGILSEWQWILESGLVPVIQITSAGRKMVRQALDLHITRHVTGTLQEWHWRALAKAYEAGDRGVPQGGIGYGRIGWNTWVRLRDYTIRGTEYPLIESSNGVTITTWGRGYYERTFVRYQKMYPNIATPDPAEQHDPQEPFIEVIEDSRICHACTGEYLVAVTRAYQQNQKWIWGVSEQEQRIPGIVTKKYREVEQCGCQEGEIQEMSAPFLTLLDQCVEQGWHLAFPYHHWFHYVDVLVGDVALGREQRWYDPILVSQKLQLLLNDTDLPDNRNIVKGEVCYFWNPRVGKGKVYPREPNGVLSLRPVAITRKMETQ
jgi:hypothetical protein